MKIKILFFALGFSFFSKYANAEWISIDSQDKRTVYSDPAAVTRNGNIATIWILINHSTIQKEANDSYLSSKGQWEVDCTAKALRQIFHVIYSGRMGGGDTIWSGALKKEYGPVVPGTIGEVTLKAACH